MSSEKHVGPGFTRQYRSAEKHVEAGPTETLTCVKCSEEFLFTESEKQFFERKKLFPPRRCPSCRRAARERRDAKHADQQPNVPEPRTPLSTAVVQALSEPRKPSQRQQDLSTVMQEHLGGEK